MTKTMMECIVKEEEAHEKESMDQIYDLKQNISNMRRTIK
jgi:hypothetical protein